MTPKQAEQWRRLTPRLRALLLSHRPDEFERDESLRRGTMRDLEDAFGPRTYDASAARVEEGESEREPHEVTEYAMTLQEIADELGLSRERVRCIEAHALRKLRGEFERMSRDEGRARRASK
jgi:hypothetical protein